MKVKLTIDITDIVINLLEFIIIKIMLIIIVNKNTVNKNKYLPK
jgi:hypothetical protein